MFHICYLRHSSSYIILLGSLCMIFVKANDRLLTRLPAARSNLQSAGGRTHRYTATRATQSEASLETCNSMNRMWRQSLSPSSFHQEIRLHVLAMQFWRTDFISYVHYEYIMYLVRAYATFHMCIVIHMTLILLLCSM